jgi:5-formyltetrahydrofolate cyclo-ligase
MAIVQMNLAQKKCDHAGSMLRGQSQFTVVIYFRLDLEPDLLLSTLLQQQTNKIYIPQSFRQRVLSWYHEYLLYPVQTEAEKTIRNTQSRLTPS